jgi:hypothetical protein
MPPRPGYFRDTLNSNGQNDRIMVISAFMSAAGVTNWTGRIVLCRKSSTGTFRVQLGVQTYDTDEELPNAPVACSVGTGTGYHSTVQKDQFIIDLTNASNGDIDTHTGFRLVLMFSDTTAATLSWGDVLVDYTLQVE